eukprot:jgi/Botrbrau1/18608/Bobra.0367s0048.1
MTWVDRRVQKSYWYRKRQQAIAAVPTELYLREDVSCGSGACPNCFPLRPRLDPAARHYVIPDADTLCDFLEVFELPEMENVIFLSSVLSQLGARKRIKRLSRLKEIYRDPRRSSILFDNAHFLPTSVKCSLQEDGRDILRAARWYLGHLDYTIPVIILSSRLPPTEEEPHCGPANELDDESCIPTFDSTEDLIDFLTREPEARGTRRVEAPREAEGPAAVRVMTPEQYFRRHWRDNAAVLDLVESLVEAREAQATEGTEASSGLYPAHLGEAALEALLAEGQVLRGVIRMSAKGPSEAEVHVSNVADSALRAVLIPTRQAINRAMHGDTVVVRVWAGSRWTNAGALLLTEDGDELAADGDDGDDAEGLASPSGSNQMSTPSRPDQAMSPSRPGLATPTRQGRGTPRRPPGFGTPGRLPRSPPGWPAQATPTKPDQATSSAGGPLELSMGALSLAELAGDSSTSGARQATGEVVGILQRPPLDIVACLQEDDERRLATTSTPSFEEVMTCIPLDRRYPKVRIRTRSGQRLIGQRFVVRVDSWRAESRWPDGHVVRILGSMDDLKVSTEAILVNAGIEWRPFCEAALKELPPVSDPAHWRVSPGDAAGRLDLRGSSAFICSIDPPGCTDVDDALSVRPLPDGGVEVGVHIADVSHFVRQGGYLDGEAASRCTTVYLTDRRLDMLPALLSEHLCSLRANCDRLAVSVLWNLGPDLAVRSTWFGRTVIRSRYQLTYQQAQEVVDGRAPPPDAGVTSADLPLLRFSLQTLDRLSAQRRAARIEAGALELESKELRFETAADGNPIRVEAKSELRAMSIVAELMIFANSSVAERIAASYPRAALLRQHPPPMRGAFSALESLCEEGGFPLDISSNAALARSLKAAEEASQDPATASLIKSLCTRAMSEAQYFSTGDEPPEGGFAHFGLALQWYTHFTSPIRRYADVVVHRQLMAALAGDPAPPVSSVELSRSAGRMNERHRQAKKAQRECSDLYMLMLLHKQPHVEAALVYKVRSKGVLLYVPKYGIKGAVPLMDRNGVVIPLLEDDVPAANPRDPFVIASRRHLSLISGEKWIRIVDLATGVEKARLEEMQRVWVRMSADASRSHGACLRMHILAPDNPAIPASMPDFDDFPDAADPLLSDYRKHAARAAFDCTAAEARRDPAGVPMPGDGAFAERVPAADQTRLDASSRVGNVLVQAFEDLGMGGAELVVEEVPEEDMEQAGGLVVGIGEQEVEAAGACGGEDWDVDVWGRMAEAGRWMVMAERCGPAGNLEKYEYRMGIAQKVLEGVRTLQERDAAVACR